MRVGGNWRRVGGGVPYMFTFLTFPRGTDYVLAWNLGQEYQ